MRFIKTAVLCCPVLQQSIWAVSRIEHLRPEFSGNVLLKQIRFHFSVDTLFVGKGTLWSGLPWWGAVPWGFKAKWWWGAWCPGPAAAPPSGRLPQTYLEWQTWSSCRHPSSRQAGKAYPPRPISLFLDYYLSFIIQFSSTTAAVVLILVLVKAGQVANSLQG